MNKPLPPTYLLLALVLVALLYLVVPGPALLRGPWRLLGALPLGAGVWLNLWADGLLKRLGTEVRPFRDSTTMVAVGPYRVSRHPMYLGMVALVLGVALLAGSLVPLVVPLGLWWILTVQFAIPEEAAMRRQFGPQYDAYARQVRRWLGRHAA
jgi:protein-S-isoprenylcysteine O-methyltransferase Ste14